MQTKKIIYRAGVIPYIIEDNNIKMLFMMPNDPNGNYGGEYFQIAKGKIEENEEAEEAAFREANEELGLFKGNILSIHDLGTFLGRTHLYLAEVKDINMFGDPHFETKKTKWMTFEEFENEGRQIHKPIVKAAVRVIQTKL